MNCNPKSTDLEILSYFLSDDVYCFFEFNRKAESFCPSFCGTNLLQFSGIKVSHYNTNRNKLIYQVFFEPKSILMERREAYDWFDTNLGENGHILAVSF